MGEIFITCHEQSRTARLHMNNSGSLMCPLSTSKPNGPTVVCHKKNPAAVNILQGVVGCYFNFIGNRSGQDVVSDTHLPIERSGLLMKSHSN